MPDLEQLAESPSTVEPTAVTCIASRKGGVGKSTIALILAQHWLQIQPLRPVVIIDADLLGTELADLRPLDRPDRWPLGLLDLLTQSTGGNTTFDETLKDWLERLDPRQPRVGPEGLPYLPLTKRGATPARLVRGATLIPTLAETSIAGRTQERGGLAERLLVDDFAVAQLQRRLAILLGRLVIDWQPSLIVIDSSPFDVALGRVARELLEKLPATFPPNLPGPIEGALKRSVRPSVLNVVGAEPGEIATCAELAHRLDSGCHGLIFNRDSHRLVHPPNEQSLACPMLDLAAQIEPEEGRAALRGSRVAHVEIEGRLLPGVLTHLIEAGGSLAKIALAAAEMPEWGNVWQAYLGGLSSLSDKVLVFDDGAFTEVTWSKFVSGLSP